MIGPDNRPSCNNVSVGTSAAERIAVPVGQLIRSRAMPAVKVPRPDALLLANDEAPKKMPSWRLPSFEVRTSAKMRFDLWAWVVQIF